MEWVETTANTVAEAKDSALDRLGVHEDDAEFEIVAEARTGLFGRVKEEARVRARVRPTAPRAKDERRRRKPKGGGRNGGKGRQGDSRDRSNGRNGGGNSSQRGQGRSKNQQEKRQGKGGDSEGARSGQSRGGRDGGRDRTGREGRGNESRKDRSEKQESSVTDNETMMPLDEQADLAQAFVQGLADTFGSVVTFSREDLSDEEIRITVEGDDLGRMIGRRGHTAGAIDDLVRTVLQRQAGSSRNGRVRVDVGGVRARRTAALEAFCREQAATVRESGVARALEPMGGADRKVIHDTIGDEEGVGTLSEGEDPNRRVVIVPDGDA